MDAGFRRHDDKNSSRASSDAITLPNWGKTGAAPRASARIELGIPVQEVAPALVQIIGRESPPIFLQLECRGLFGSTLREHARLSRQPVALEQVAVRAGGDAVVPVPPPAPGARDDVIEGQLVRRAAAAAILAAEAVAQED